MTTLYEAGDAIHGDQVICMYRKIKKSRLIQKIKTHKGSMVTLVGSVHCVIDHPIAIVTPDLTTSKS